MSYKKKHIESCINTSYISDNTNETWELSVSAWRSRRWERASLTHEKRKELDGLQINDFPKLTRELTSYTKCMCVCVFIIEKEEYIKINTTCFYNFFTTLKIKGI